MHFLGKLGINLCLSRHPPSTREESCFAEPWVRENKLKMDQEIPSSALLFHLSPSFCFSLYKWPLSSAVRSWQLLGGCPRFLPLKVLWVQSRPSRRLAFEIPLTMPLSFLFALSSLGLSNSAALVDHIPACNTLPHRSPTSPPPNKLKLRLTCRSY